MTTTPDYAAIYWVLENVEGARPKSMRALFPCYLARDGDQWMWLSPNKFQVLLHTDDALAILRDWWCEWVRSETAKQWAKHEPMPDGEVKYRLVDGEPIYNASSEYGIHPDRTTALAMLVLRVAGKETA